MGADILAGEIKSFEDLEVWQLGRTLTLRVYELTEAFPQREIYGLADQIRRAAVSVPDNVAEGFGRYHYMDRVRFFLNARGSLNELKSHMLIGKDLGLFDHDETGSAMELIETLSVKLNNLISATRRSQGS